ncbi:thermostable hemolysin [Kaarinaea lacus]
MTLNVAVDVNKPNVVSKELVLDLFEPESSSSKNSDRRDVETFIHRVFSRAYDADLNHYLPRLMSLRNPDNRVIAALGMREASSGPLFLETYLDSPVEHVISRLSDTLTTRRQIMEVGNLASMHRGGLRNLIIALTSYLRGAGSEWVVFTAVPAVRNAFEALDLPLYTLAVADKSRLDEKERANWGRYYETGPVVVAGKVEDGYRRIRELIDLEKAMSLSCYLWQYAFNAGCKQRNINLKPTK